MLNLKAKVSFRGWGSVLIQLLLLGALPLPSVEAQTPCSPERVRTLSERLRNESPPSPESREIRSERHRFKFQVPANYRAVTFRDSILILSPEAYEFHQCQPRTTFWYAAAIIYVMDSDFPPSFSLEQVFERRPAEQQEGRVQRVSLAGIPALRYHAHEGGDGLTRRYFFRSPQGTKTITIFSWVNSVNAREPEVLSRITNNVELLFSITEDPPRVGIVPTLEVCGLAVWNAPDDNLTHILTAMGGSSSANFRLDNQLLQLRTTGPEINPGRTGSPSSFTFQNSDRSIQVRLQGDWRIEHPGATSGWVTNNATLEVSQGNQTRELSVFASLGCQFLFF